MAKDVETQLAEKLTTRKFSWQMYKSTVRDIEAVVTASLRHIDNGESTEEKLFCEALKTTITAIYIYNNSECI